LLLSLLASQLAQVQPLSRLPAYRTAPAPAPSAVVVPIDEEGESGGAGEADVEDTEGGGRKLAHMTRNAALPLRARAYGAGPAPAPAPAAGIMSADQPERGIPGRKLAQMTRMGAKDVQRGRGKMYRLAPAPAPGGALAEDLAELPLSPLGAPAGARRALLQGNAPLRRPVLPAVVQQAQMVSERAPAPAPSRARGGDVAEAPAAT
jgi:hypothetical protein